MLYDFEKRRIRIIDLDHYRSGPFRNEMGRLFGSSRFMAPEEFVRGAQIDESTTVFTMGRVASVFLGGEVEDWGATGLRRVVHRACASAPSARFPSVADFFAAWSEQRPEH